MLLEKKLKLVWIFKLLRIIVLYNLTFLPWTVIYITKKYCKSNIYEISSLLHTISNNYHYHYSIPSSSHHIYLDKNKMSRYTQSHTSKYYFPLKWAVKPDVSPWLWYFWAFYPSPILLQALLMWTFEAATNSTMYSAEDHEKVM